MKIRSIAGVVSAIALATAMGAMSLQEAEAKSIGAIARSAINSINRNNNPFGRYGNPYYGNPYAGYGNPYAGTNPYLGGYGYGYLPQQSVISRLSNNLLGGGYQMSPYGFQSRNSSIKNVVTRYLGQRALNSVFRGF